MFMKCVEELKMKVLVAAVTLTAKIFKHSINFLKAKKMTLIIILGFIGGVLSGGIFKWGGK